jgi:hypothetical protein
MQNLAKIRSEIMTRAFKFTAIEGYLMATKEVEGPWERLGASNHKA